MGSFSFNLYGFFAFLQRLKMTRRAIFTKTARDDRCKKSKNKVFKRFNVLKSVSNEREREREKSPAQTLLHFRFAHFACKQRYAQRHCVKMTQSVCIIFLQNLPFFKFFKIDL